MDKEKLASLSGKIRDVVEHFKQVDPVGIPGAPIQDPMAIPDMKHSKAFMTMTLFNSTVHGLSKFRIDQVYSNLAVMQAQVALKYAKIEMQGNYTLSNLFSRTSGGFNVTLSGVYVEAIALLKIARAGNLEATDIKMDISTTDIDLDFKNLGFLLTLFQGMVNSLGPFIFDNIKPYVLSEFHTNVRGDVNKYLLQLKQTFPNSIPPLDLAIAKGRKFVRTKYDPYKVEDYSYSAGIFSVNLVEMWVTGLASFYRIGNVTVYVTNNTVQLESRLSTKRLKGSCQWEASFGGVVSRYGASSFSVEYLQVEAKVNQSLNVRNTPKLQDFQMKLGNIQLRMDGLGTMDYILEFMSNILPNILRYQIVDALEGIMKQRIQDALNIIDVEKEIDKFLQDLDNNPNKTLKTMLDPPEDDFDLMDDLADDMD